MPCYRIVIECDGVPPQAGPQGAKDITENFKARPWHRVAKCDWNGKSLTLTAENDYDSRGLALQDEFSDEISACIAEPFDGGLRIVSIVHVSPAIQSSP